MFFRKRYDDSVKNYKKEIQILEETIDQVKKQEVDLNTLRLDCKCLLVNIVEFINTIANTPKEINNEVEHINSNLEDIKEIHNCDKYVNQMEIALKASNRALACGTVLLISAGVSCIKKNEYIEENDDTGTSIDVNDKVSKLRGLFLVIGGSLFGIGLLIRLINYQQKSKEIYSEIAIIKDDCCELKKYSENIKEIYEKTESTFETVNQLLENLMYLKNSDYSQLSEDEKTRLCVLKDYAEKVISKLLHKKVEGVQ